MKERELVKDTGYLELNKEILNSIYQHVWFLANFRFARPIMILQTRHRGYEKEDFVQEVVELVCDLFKTMKFPTINHLKKIIKTTMSYHYLHEKRKYFYTKSRGSISCMSLDDDINDYKKFEDVAITDKSFNDETIYDVHRLFDKNLYLAYNWKFAKVITKEQIKDFTNYYILSINFFITKQRELGLHDTCKFYKQNGYYMTKKIFDYLSQTIIDYLKSNDIIMIENFDRCQNHHKFTYFNEEKIELAKYTCTCGYIYDERDVNDYLWQCPICGKLHDKSKLKDYNLGLSKNYHPQESKLIVFQDDSQILNDTKIIINKFIEKSKLNPINIDIDDFKDTSKDALMTFDDLVLV